MPQLQDITLTEEGLTMKGIRKIERLNCDSSQVDVNIRTWQCSRIIRRDFNLVTYKMFFVSRKPELRRKLRDLLKVLADEAQTVATIARRYELPREKPVSTHKLRIVSPEARALLDAILELDRSLFKLSQSEMKEVATDNCDPFFARYGRLKAFVLEQNRNPKVGAAQDLRSPLVATVEPSAKKNSAC